MFLLLGPSVFPQLPVATKQDVFLDSNGVMRWKGSNTEVALFGVNYTTPFAYSYRAHKKLGLSLKKAIDLDVAQMIRLGFDAFRVHVWDREISDKAGNMITNEHLDLLDYLIWKLESHGIKIILTPIAWWGNGWPEPDELTSGFSQSYSKLELITNAEARAAERNYLKQFIHHLNPYSKHSYGNDPSIIAMEIINEPFHPDNGKEVTDYINEMVAVMRGTGYNKPLFYNISQNWNPVQAQAVCKANIQGVSFQWYPTDLVHNKMLKGNYLLNVNHYKIPSDGVSGYNKKTKMVYEFEAADVGGSYMYPAMARSFREAGMQFATMFSYDPTQIAWSNTEYPTHYLNLLYTPSKAISLMIAGLAFHDIPRYSTFGDYPANNKFGDFRVSFDEDLSLANTDSCFYYANSTAEVPMNLSGLKHIAGCGNSVPVKYDGTGAYFLDKLAEGVWKLEVYPDALWLGDPFEPTGMSRQVSRLYWNQRRMSVSLPGLTNSFFVNAMKKGKSISVPVDRGEFLIKPGVYIISAKMPDKKMLGGYLAGSEQFLADIYIPANEPGIVSVINKTEEKQAEEGKVKLKFQIASDKEISGAEVFLQRLGWRGYTKYLLKKEDGFLYGFNDSVKMAANGELRYCLAVKSGNKTFTFPGGIQGSPDDWDFRIDNPWSLSIAPQNENISLFNVSTDYKDILIPHFNTGMRYTLDYPGTWDSNIPLSVKVSYSTENIIPFVLQFSVADKIKSKYSSNNEYKNIVIRAQSNQAHDSKIKINLLLEDGRCYTVPVALTKGWKDIALPLSSFMPGDAYIMPSAYPLFLPKTWRTSGNKDDHQLNPGFISAVQIVCDDHIVTPETGKIESGFEVESVYLTVKAK